MSGPRVPDDPGLDPGEDPGPTCPLPLNLLPLDPISVRSKKALTALARDTRKSTQALTASRHARTEQHVRGIFAHPACVAYGARDERKLAPKNEHGKHPGNRRSARAVRQDRHSLVNLGTPDAADAAGVRRYLKQFLSDPRVIEDQGLLWKLVLNGVVLPLRPVRKARDYRKI